MNRIQRYLALFYGFLTVLVLIFHWLFAGGVPSLILTFSIRVTMVAAAFLLPTVLKERKRLRTAFVFTLVSDFFFVFMKIFDRDMPNRTLYGLVGFIFSYFFLTWTFSDGLRLGKKEVLTFLPYLGIFLFLFVTLSQYAEGFMYPAGIGIGVVLSFAAATMASTLFRGRFTRKAALFIAVGGSMMFFSDLFVAYSIYHPDWKAFMLWKENMIWGTYVPAWTLLLMLLAEEKPYLEAVPETAHKLLGRRAQRA